MGITHKKSLKMEYGVRKTEKEYCFTISMEAKNSASLRIYDLKGILLCDIDLREYRIAGSVFSVAVNGLPEEGIQYEYLCDGELFPDLYLKSHSYKRPYGEEKSSKDNDRAVFCDTGYEWEEDKQLRIPYTDVTIYQLHVRGFTKHASSKVKGKGCFLGITEKIQYFKDLGINQIELMPAYEFYELDSQLDSLPKHHPSFTTDYTLDAKGNVIKNTPKVKINYWGYKKASYFCPKFNYSYNLDAIKEFKDMVKALHKAGIEIVMQMYFNKNTDACLIRDCLRFWYMEYHIDGFHLMGESIPMNVILKDALINEAKLYFNNFDRNSELFANSSCKYVADVNDGFMYASRRFLKSDSDSLSAFVNATRSNPSAPYNINYITSYQGFTLNDLVSYECKHNESNGENNSDGTDYNLSWNCGVEGKCSKKAVKEMRIRQIKNALSMLFLAQGTPMLFMGDEMMNSQNGNNNPYCQDNEITWLDWKLNKSSEEILNYTKKIICLRKSHKVVHFGKELKGMDYLSEGFPDISYHQDMAWKSEFNSYMLHFGILYWGAYAVNPDGNKDDSIFIAYNMHWEDHSFGLPRLKQGMKWEYVSGTCSDLESKKFIAALNDEQEEINVYKRSVIVLKAVKPVNNNGPVKEEK